MLSNWIGSKLDPPQNQAPQSLTVGITGLVYLLENEVRRIMVQVHIDSPVSETLLNIIKTSLESYSTGPLLGFTGLYC